eukprot:7918581-Prorocentrum_lima.AAC.1
MRAHARNSRPRTCPRQPIPCSHTTTAPLPDSVGGHKAARAAPWAKDARGAKVPCQCQCHAQ